MNKQVALLRGINVGGNKKVPMALLRQMLSEMGFESPKTLLNSGNVVFETNEKDETQLVEKLEKQIEKTFGFHVNVMVRTMEEIKNLLKLDPFKKIPIEKDIRLYVTFLPKISQSQLKLPFISLEKDFQIIQKTSREVFSVLNLKTAKSVDSMAFWKKNSGKILPRGIGIQLKKSQKSESNDRRQRFPYNFLFHGRGMGKVANRKP